MSKELKELLDKINSKKKDVRNLVAENELDKADEVMDEIKTLQRKFDLLAETEAEEEREREKEVKDIVDDKKKDKTKNIKNVFVKAIKAMFKKATLTQEDKEILDSMNETTPEDGGLTVPSDIRTEIRELRRSTDALENLVNVEYTTTSNGTRVIEIDAENTPFDNVEEAEEFPEESTPEFNSVEYSIKKKGGILTLTRELLQDSAENILAYLKKWIAKKSKATRNFMILKKIREITEGKEVNIVNLDSFKDIFNVTLDPAIALSSGIITNQFGYNWLDKLKDNDGKYVLQPDPTQPTKKLLFGEYPVIKLSKKTLKNYENGIPFICGDLKEAITIFDREQMTIDINDTAGEYWKKDKTALKVRERLDIQAVDEEAVVVGIVPFEENPAKPVNPPALAADGTDLNTLTKELILAKAVEEGLELDVTVNNKKDEIIADYLAKEAAKNNA